MQVRGGLRRLALAAPSAAEVLSIRGVIDQSAPDIADPAALVNLILADSRPGLAAFAVRCGRRKGPKSGRQLRHKSGGSPN
ncbi:MAG: hypothetical protein R3D78_11715 [Paracoccaceae bacterium]